MDALEPERIVPSAEQSTCNEQNSLVQSCSMIVGEIGPWSESAQVFKACRALDMISFSWQFRRDKRRRKS